MGLFAFLSGGGSRALLERRCRRVHLGPALAAEDRTRDTLDVFALTVHFRPEDWVLRLGALLHDAGHLPFSHSAERALGADHHRLTVRLLEEGGPNVILARHGFDPAAVLAAMEGAPSNPLVPGPGGLGPPERAVRRGVRPSHCREIVRRVAADHRLFLKPRCVGLDALVTEIFAGSGLAPETLLDTGDEGALDRVARVMPDLVDRLRNRPWTVQVREDDGGPGWSVQVTKLYTAPPACPVAPCLDGGGGDGLRVLRNCCVTGTARGLLPFLGNC